MQVGGDIKLSASLYEAGEAEVKVAYTITFGTGHRRSSAWTQDSLPPPLGLISEICLAEWFWFEELQYQLRKYADLAEQAAR